MNSFFFFFYISLPTSFCCVFFQSFSLNFLSFYQLVLSSPFLFQPFFLRYVLGASSSFLLFYNLRLLFSFVCFFIIYFYGHPLFSPVFPQLYVLVYFSHTTLRHGRFSCTKFELFSPGRARCHKSSAIHLIFYFFHFYVCMCICFPAKAVVFHNLFLPWKTLWLPGLFYLC